MEPLKRCSSAPIISNISAVPLPGSAVTPNSTSMSSAQQITSSPSSDQNRPNNLNIFSRTRRYSASSFSPLASSSSSNPARRLTPRVSQLRQEECADISNSREVNHERDLHSALQISQSWEDLTIVTENWTCRDDLANPSNCSSPSPTSRNSNLMTFNSNSNNSNSIRYPFGMSPSPTRKTFATRRSMSPNSVRPSQLCPVKRRFDMEECNTNSPPPYKKIFLDTRGSSPSCQTMIPICPSPDSGTYEGRTTPKLYISKLCSNSRSSFSSASASPTSQLEMNVVGEKTNFDSDKMVAKLSDSDSNKKEEVEDDDVPMTRSGAEGDICDNEEDNRIDVDQLICDNSKKVATEKEEEEEGEKKSSLCNDNSSDQGKRIKDSRTESIDVDDGIGMTDEVLDENQIDSEKTLSSAPI